MTPPRALACLLSSFFAVVAVACNTSGGTGSARTAGPDDGGQSADGATSDDAAVDDASMPAKDAAGGDAPVQADTAGMCSPYLGSCQGTDHCCTGLTCVNGAYCCANQGVKVGSCVDGTDCCSGHCDLVSNNCCNGSDQACPNGDSDCCTGYQCSGSGGATCCASPGTYCGGGTATCCPSTVCGTGTEEQQDGTITSKPNVCCVPATGSCSTLTDCCFDADNCFQGTCCKSIGRQCASDAECCGGTGCTNGMCQ